MRIVVLDSRGRAVRASDRSVWSGFCDELSKMGIETVETPLRATIDGLFTINHRGHYAERKIRSQVPRESRVLFASEPPVVDPSMYRRRVLNCYGHIYSPSPARLVNRDVGVQLMFRSHREIDLVDAFVQVRGACIISGNKYSFVKGENYSLRRQIVILCRQAGVPLYLFGEGWDSRQIRHRILALARCLKSGTLPVVAGTRFSSARRENCGRVSDKLRTARLFRVAVVVENCSDYVSEKLFDAVDAGCVVIYVGAALDTFGLRGAAFECRRDARQVCGEILRVLALEPAEIDEIRTRQSQVVALARKESDEAVAVRKLARKVGQDLLCALGEEINAGIGD